MTSEPLDTNILNTFEIETKWRARKPSRLQRRILDLRPAKDSYKEEYHCPSLVRVSNSRETYFFPSPLPSVNCNLMRNGYAKRLLRKYSFEDFVEVEPGDWVVDCGAYVGAFSLLASSHAEMVLACEPAPRNYAALALNTERTPNIRCVNVALYNHDGALPFNYGTSNSTDSSLITPDSKDSEQLPSISVRRLSTLIKDIGWKRVDFLKLEAEGVEKEIATSVDPATVKKLAIDCSPERDGRSPLLDIAILLSNKGYTLKARNYMLFAVAP
jgi:FkbM family methyltransferase